MGDRFRLVYLKSTGTEKPVLDEFSPSPDRDKNLKAGSAGIQTSSPLSETLSSQMILKQAKLDLEHLDPKVRILAIQYVQKENPSTALPLLQEVLTDQDPEVRAQGILSLSQLQDPAVSPLLKKYLEDHDPRVRIAALRGLFKRTEKVDLKLLLQFLSDESPWVRRKMATLLGWTQMEGVFPILVEMSKDHNVEVRKAALFSLMTLYPEEIEDRLLDAMNDTDENLRRWAKKALEKIAVSPVKEKDSR